jgi:protein-S-isoprenylcysteine O-methyltransferase Ste14
MEKIDTKYIILSLVWIGYLALHSTMISITVINFLKNRLLNNYRFYRLFYNTVAVATLIPVILYSVKIQDQMFYIWDGYLYYIKWFVRTVGLLLFVAGIRHYSMLQFLGIKQITDGSKHNLMNLSGELDATGILGMLRHPFYSGVILLFWARDLDNTRLIINTIVTVYVIIGTLLEERKLIIEFDEKYREYQQKVSMFVPWKWLKNKFRV